MNVRVDSDALPRSRPFPRLMISTGDAPGQIVLFVDDSQGTCLVPGETTDWTIGEWHTAWDMNRFKDFVGSVTLSN